MYLHTLTLVRPFLCALDARMDYELQRLCITNTHVLYSGKRLREKTITYFAVLWLFAKVIMAGITHFIFTPLDEVGFLQLQLRSHLPNSQFTLVRNYGVS